MALSRFFSPRRSLLSTSICVATLLAGLTTRVHAQAGNGIADAIANLSSGDRERVVAGRKQLIDGLTGGMKNPDALKTYAADVATAIGPVLAGNDPHAKLNAAIALQRIADSSGSLALVDPVINLINDPSPAIATYGLRASANLTPRVLADAALADRSKLVPSIMGAMQRHLDSEAVVTESYLTLTRALNDRQASDILGAQIVKLAIPRTVDAVHALIETRIPQFGNGKVAEPPAESPAVAFLGKQSTWDAMTQPQRDKTISLLLQLMGASAGEMETVNARNTPGADRERLLALRRLCKSAAGSLSVIAQVLKNADLQTSTDLVKPLGDATPVADYKRVAGIIQNDFGRVFPNLKTSTQPTTAPQ